MQDTQKRLKDLETGIKGLLNDGVINDNSGSTVQTFSSKKLIELFKEKLGKNETATNSDKLEGFSSADFLQSKGLLSDGDANSPSYWHSLQRGTYYYNAELRTVANMPVGITHGHVELRNVDGEMSVVLYTADGGIFVRSGTLNGLRPWVNAVTRDANGDFAGRTISAEYFKMTAPDQDDGFSNDCRIIYRANDTDNAYLRSVKFSKVASFLEGLGVNQTLLTLTEQRQANTIYENTTNKPIYVSVMAKPSQSGGTVSAQLFINDVLVSEGFHKGSDTSSPIVTVCGIVPKGARYKIVLNHFIGQTIFHSWAELR